MRCLKLLIILSALLAFGQSRPFPQAHAQTSTLPVVTKADESGLTLRWTLPDVELSTLEVDGVDYSVIEMSGLFAQGAPGQPELPSFSKSVGLPPSGDVQLRVLEIQRDVIPLPHLPLPAPIPEPVSLSLADPGDPAFFGGLTRIEPDPAVYGSDAFFPAATVELGDPYRLLNWRFAALRIHPVRVNPVSRQLEVVRLVRLELTFDEPASPSLSSQAAAGPLATALAGSVLNPGALQWPAASRDGQLQSQVSPVPDAADMLVKVVVDEPGLYALSYNDLQAADVPVGSLDPRTVQLSYGSSFQPVAITVEGEADGAFDPADRLLFYAEPTFSRYTDEDVYFLSHNQSSPPRIQSRSANPQGLSVGTAWATSYAESNKIYNSKYPGRDGDYWYWTRLWSPLVSNELSSSDFFVSLVNPRTAGPDATLTIWMQGETDSDHFVEVRFNGGKEVDLRQWNGIQQIEAQFSVPASMLQSGSNLTNISLPDRGILRERMLVDAMQLTYAINRGGTQQLIFEGEDGQKSYTLSGWPAANLLIYDITDSASPRLLFDYLLANENGSYRLTLGDADASLSKYLIVPKDRLKTPAALRPVQLLADPVGGADYIIITHPDFAQAIQPLASHREARGLRVFTADVNAVYDTYGGGRATPVAIRNFLQHAYETWPTVPLFYALLVGDGSYDFKNYSGFNPQNFIPPLMSHVPWWLDETAVDNRLVTFEGSNLPSMMIGRLPVNSAAETSTVVDKIIQYETNPFPGGWNARHLFVSGDGVSGRPEPSAEDFMNSAERAVAKLTDPNKARRFFYDPEATGEETYIYNDHETLRARLISDWNYGASVITFHGHSSFHQWNDEPILRWSLVAADNDVTQLRNGRRLPVVIGMTCYTSFFHHPEYPTIDESLLRQSTGGAIATWGSTGLGVATGHDALQEGFYSAITNGETNLGAAALAGKQQLFATKSNQDLLDTFTLLGDPALTLDFTVVPFSHHLYLPTVHKN